MAVLFYLFLAVIPFGYRTLLYQFTDEFVEYGSVFLYASDIIFVLFLFLFGRWVLRTKPGFTGSRYAIFLGLFLGLTTVSIAFSSYPLLGFYNFLRFGLLGILALAAAYLIQCKVISLRGIFTVIAASAVFQSVLAFFQFLLQKSLGLWFLGESVIKPEAPEAARIFIDGAWLIRGYGTFPHPNILAAFLLLGVISLFYLWFTKASTPTQRVVISSSLFIVFLGVLLTFSRTAWALGVIASLFILIFYFVRSRDKKQVAYFGLLLVMSALLLGLAFHQLIFDRVSASLIDSSLVERQVYNDIGLRISKENLLGVGLGNQVLYAIDNDLYKEAGMTISRQWQPVHNIYLLITSEIGIVGLLAFVGFVLLVILGRRRSSEAVFPLSMLGALLLFGLFDHFLWTLQPGRLMLWLLIGILLGTSLTLREKGSHSSTDRT